MRPGFWVSIAEDARACPFQLLARRKNVGDLETEMMNGPARIFSQEFGYGRMLAERFDQLDFGVFELDEDHGDPVLGEIVGVVNMGAEQIAGQIERLRTGAKDEAVRELKLFFILQKIANEQNVDVEEPELNGRIAMLAAHRGVRPEKLKQEMAKDGTLANLYIQMREQKAVDTILQDATVEDVDVLADKKKDEEEKKTTKKSKKSKKDDSEEKAEDDKPKAE